MSSRHTRPKRPEPPSSSSSHLDAALHSITSSSRPTSKKPRFDARNPHALAPEQDEDPADLFLEIDEGAVNRTRHDRRAAVELEGYASDSSEEGFDATRKVWKDSERAEATKDDDGDDDMFGGDGSGPDDDPSKTQPDTTNDKKKNVKFLDLEDIEGQDFSSRKEYLDIIDEDKGKGDDDDDNDDGAAAAEPEEIDEEIGAGGSKKHAPKIDAFNMASEMEEGRFDESGNFIRMKQEKDAVHDSWLQGVSRKDMARAAEAMERRETEKREEERRRDGLVTSEVLASLIPFLRTGESVLEALARLGGGRKQQKKESWREKKLRAKQQHDADAMVQDKAKAPEDPKERRRKETVERVTEAADLLLTRGQLEIYEETREGLCRQFQRETGEAWKGEREPEGREEEDASGEAGEAGEDEGKEWEFRWADGRDEVVHGPYKAAEMKAWNEHEFFAAGAEFRERGTTEWSRVPGF